MTRRKPWKVKRLYNQRAEFGEFLKKAHLKGKEKAGSMKGGKV